MSSVNKWLVEVRYPSSTGPEVRHFYLVDGAASSEQACSRARERALVACERSRRHIVEMRYQWGSVQRILSEPLGGFTLSAPFPPAEHKPLAGSVVPAVGEA